MNTIYSEKEEMPSEYWEKLYGKTTYEGVTPKKGGSRAGQRLDKYKSHCWSKRVKAGSPHWHIILTKEGETFAFWATGWRQLVYKSDTFDFIESCINEKKKFDFVFSNAHFIHLPDNRLKELSKISSICEYAYFQEAIINIHEDFIETMNHDTKETKLPDSTYGCFLEKR